MDCSQAPLSMGILQVRTLEWAAMPSSKGASQLRDQTQVSHIAGGFFTSRATRQAHCNLTYHLVVQMVKHLPITWETWVWSLGWEDPLEKKMATHSSTLAWKIPWMEESSRLQSMGSQRVRHDWATSLISLKSTSKHSPLGIRASAEESWCGVGGEGHNSVHNNSASIAWLSHSSLLPPWPLVCNFSVVLSNPLPVNARVPQNSIVRLLLFPTNPMHIPWAITLICMVSTSISMQDGAQIHISSSSSPSSISECPTTYWLFFYETKKCQTPQD